MCNVCVVRVGQHGMARDEQACLWTNMTCVFGFGLRTFGGLGASDTTIWKERADNVGCSDETTIIGFVERAHGPGIQRGCISKVGLVTEVFGGKTR